MKNIILILMFFLITIFAYTEDDTKNSNDNKTKYNFTIGGALLLNAPGSLNICNPNYDYFKSFSSQTILYSIGLGLGIPFSFSYITPKQNLAIGFETKIGYSFDAGLPVSSMQYTVMPYYLYFDHQIVSDLRFLLRFGAADEKEKGLFELGAVFKAKFVVPYLTNQISGLYDSTQTHVYPYFAGGPSLIIGTEKKSDNYSEVSAFRIDATFGYMKDIYDSLSMVLIDKPYYEYLSYFYEFTDSNYNLTNQLQVEISLSFEYRWSYNINK